jgi:diadenylate cyclase
MKRVEFSPQLQSLVKATRRLADENGVETVLLIAELPYDFAEIAKYLRKVRLVVASEQPDVQRAASEDKVDLIPLLHEPQTRQVQIRQSILEGITDELLTSGARIIVLYAGFDRDRLDSFSLVDLEEELIGLTARDLRKIDTDVPLNTLRLVVDLAVEIGAEGREGKPIGTLFVVGNHRTVMKMSEEQVHDPFRGYTQKECQIRDPRVQESIKELACIDGAFVVSAEGIVIAAGRILKPPKLGVSVSAGLGARHHAAASISKATESVAIAVSESTGTVRIFHDGKVVLRIEQAGSGVGPMRWENDPEASE